jgi:hypothetical protein
VAGSSTSNTRSVEAGSENDVLKHATGCGPDLVLRPSRSTNAPSSARLFIGAREFKK